MATVKAVKVGLITSLNDDRFRVLKPFEVEVEKDGVNTIIWCEALTEFGYGSYGAAAIRDFQYRVVELYDILAENQDRLGARMQRKWETLRSHVELQV